MNNQTIRDQEQEREWQVQEWALQQERLRSARSGDDPHALDDPDGLQGLSVGVDDDSLVQRYRMLARTLRAPLPDALPTDFAHEMALQIKSAQRPGNAAIDASPVAMTSFERRMLGLLIAAFGLALGAVIAVCSTDALGSLVALGHSSARLIGNPWLLSLMACVVVSRALDTWPRGSHSDQH
jgi:hypothetical protein